MLQFHGQPTFLSAVHVISGHTPSTCSKRAPKAIKQRILRQNEAILLPSPFLDKPVVKDYACIYTFDFVHFFLPTGIHGVVISSIHRLFVLLY